MKHVRICGDCGATLHKKWVKGRKWGDGITPGYFAGKRVHSLGFETLMKHRRNARRRKKRWL